MRVARLGAAGGPLTVEQWPSRSLLPSLSKFDADYVIPVGLPFQL